MDIHRVQSVVSGVDPAIDPMIPVQQPLFPIVFCDDYRAGEIIAFR